MKSVTKYVRKTQTFKHFIEQDDGKDNIEEGYYTTYLFPFACFNPDVCTADAFFSYF